MRVCVVCAAGSDVDGVAAVVEDLLEREDHRLVVVDASPASEIVDLVARLGARGEVQATAPASLPDEFVAVVAPGTRVRRGWTLPLVGLLEADRALEVVAPVVVDDSGTVVDAGAVDVGGQLHVVAAEPSANVPALRARWWPDAPPTAAVIHRSPAVGVNDTGIRPIGTVLVDGSVPVRGTPRPGPTLRALEARAAQARRHGDGGLLVVQSVSADRMANTALIDHLVEVGGPGRSVAWWAPGGSSPISVSRLSAAGVAVFGTSLEPGEVATAGPRDRAALRLATQPPLAACLVALQPSTTILGDAGTAARHLSAVRLFCPTTSAVVCVGGLRQLVGSDASVAASLIPTADRLVALSATDQQEALEALPGLDPDEFVALGDPRLTEPRPVPDPQIPAVSTDGREPGRVSVVIPVWNKLELTRACIESVRQHSPAGTEIVVVDNGSTDRTAAWLEREPGLVVIRNEENRGFPVAANQGIRASTGEFVVLLNNDTRVPRRWLDGLIRPFEDPSVGAVGPRADSISGPQLVVGVGSTRAEFARAAEQRRRDHLGETWEHSRLVGFCIALRIAALEEVGGLDESFGLGNFEDDDLSVRLTEAGWRLLVADEVLVHHEGSASFGSEAAAAIGRARRVFEHRHGLLRSRGDLLTACVIMRDEEEMLPDCLLTVAGLADEIVVCDTGSRDRSRAIALAAGCRVIDHPWDDDFAAARNAALEAARSSWVLFIDADERVDSMTPRQAQELRRLLVSTDRNAFQVRISSVGVGLAADREGGLEHWLERVMRRDRFRYRGRLHERLLPIAGGEVLLGRLESLTLLHEGYRSDVREERQKAERNERIARRYYESDEDPKWFRAMVYAKSTSDSELQLRLYLEAADVPVSDRDGYVDLRGHVGQALAGAAAAAHNLGRHDEAVSHANAALDEVPGHALARYARGVSLEALGMLEEAEIELAGLVADGPSGLEQVSDSRWHQVDGPAALMRVRLRRGAEAGGLEAIAAGDPVGFTEWAALADELRTAHGAPWAGRLAVLARSNPAGALGAVEQLDPVDGLRLCDALAADGAVLGLVGFVAISTAARLDGSARDEAMTRWLGRVGQAGAEVAGLVAARLESTVPEAALALWSQVPGGAGSVGRARALVAAGDDESAVDALDGVAADELPAEDRLFVAALAARVGALELAVRLLQSVRPDEDGVDAAAIAQTAEQIATAAGR